MQFFLKINAYDKNCFAAAIVRQRLPVNYSFAFGDSCLEALSNFVEEASVLRW